MEIQQESPEGAITSGCAYSPPRLRLLGDLASLTAAGSGIQSENGQPGNCSQENHRQPCR